MKISEGTPNVIIDEDDYRTFTCVWYVTLKRILFFFGLAKICYASSRTGNVTEVGVVHSDTAIPDALPAFYFEIRVVEDGRRANNNGYAFLTLALL